MEAFHIVMKIELLYTIKTMCMSGWERRERG